MAIDVNVFLNLLPAANASSTGNLRELIALLRKPNVTGAQVMSAVQKIQPAIRQGQGNARAFDYLQSNYTAPRLPQNFQWLVPQAVAGMSKFDENPDVLGAMVDLYRKGVRTIISIEGQDAATWVKDWTTGFDKTQWFGTFLADWHAPSVEHLAAYCNLVDERRPAGGVVTHCWGGTGRTGCFLAAYLIKSENMPAHRALKAVRQRYSVHSVEMKAQYNAMARYADFLQRSMSWPLGSDEFDHAGGHWHGAHGDDGIGEDPGHKNDRSAKQAQQWKEGVDNAMISSAGKGSSAPPYVSSRTDMRPQQVAG
jgi:insecticidal toxin complex protein TccC